MPIPNVKGKERSRTKKGRWRRKRSDRLEAQKLDFLKARKNDIMDKIENLQNQLARVNALIERMEKHG